MAKAKTNGFRLLPSYYEAIRDLPDDSRLAMYDAIFDCGFGNEVKDLPPLLNGYFMLIKPSLEKSIKFETKQKANGGKGGRPTKPKTDLGYRKTANPKNPTKTLPLPLPLPLLVPLIVPLIVTLTLISRQSRKKRKSNLSRQRLKKSKPMLPSVTAPLIPWRFWSTSRPGNGKTARGSPCWRGSRSS